MQIITSGAKHFYIEIAFKFTCRQQQKAKTLLALQPFCKSSSIIAKA
jgi:hypothetical protein